MLDTVARRFLFPFSTSFPLVTSPLGPPSGPSGPVFEVTVPSVSHGSETPQASAHESRVGGKIDRIHDPGLVQFRDTVWKAHTSAS